MSHFGHSSGRRRRSPETEIAVLCTIAEAGLDGSQPTCYPTHICLHEPRPPLLRCRGAEQNTPQMPCCSRFDVAGHRSCWHSLSLALTWCPNTVSAQALPSRGALAGMLNSALHHCPAQVLCHSPGTCSCQDAVHRHEWIAMIWCSHVASCASSNTAGCWQCCSKPLAGPLKPVRDWPVLTGPKVSTSKQEPSLLRRLWAFKNGVQSMQLGLMIV